MKFGGHLEVLAYGPKDGRDRQKIWEESLLWAHQQLERGYARLKAAGVEADLEGLMFAFSQSLRSTLDSRQREEQERGRPAPPAVFEIVRLADLDPRVKADGGGLGVQVSFYPNGHLKRAVVVDRAVLEVARDKPRARYEDSANVAEYRPDGTIDSYGGRYERTERSRVSFATWVKERVKEMADLHDFG